MTGIGLYVVGVPASTPDAGPQVAAGLAKHPEAVFVVAAGPLCQSIHAALLPRTLQGGPERRPGGEQDGPAERAITPDELRRPRGDQGAHGGRLAGADGAECVMPGAEPVSRRGRNRRSIGCTSRLVRALI